MGRARLGSVDGRAVLINDALTSYVDLEHASRGSLSSSAMECFVKWDLVRQIAETSPLSGWSELDQSKLESPVPQPRQVFAIGINYKAHASEMGNALPIEPLVFTKFQSSISSPNSELTIVGGKCDFEAELVVVISKGGRDIHVDQAWQHIAGLCVGQDFSDRTLQYANTPPQFSLGKSRAGFAKFGPWITDSTNFEVRNDLAMRCQVSGETMQSTRTSDMIFEVQDIIAYLSTICELFPGDVIYTGTPSGVGAGRKPPRFLQPGDVVETTIDYLGTLRNICV